MERWTGAVSGSLWNFKPLMTFLASVPPLMSLGLISTHLIMFHALRFTALRTHSFELEDKNNKESFTFDRSMADVSHLTLESAIP